MIYADSSALLKLVFAEDESPALRTWLSERRPESIVSSELARIEVVRAARRTSDARLEAEGRAIAADLDVVPMDRAVQDLAAEIGDPSLRTLDAIHLASAILIRDELTGFVAYDQRLVDAAREAGLQVVRPGSLT